MTTKVITAHVPSALAKKVDDLAVSMERSRGWIVKEALAAWVIQEEERTQWTLDALADVDAGRTVDHEAVRAWAVSLSTENPLPIPSVAPAASAYKRPKRRKP